MFADGIIVVEPSDISGEEKVFVQVLAAFRYGREDLDVLGMTFKKDLYVATKQVFPPPKEESGDLTRMQDRLAKKLGKHAYPFVFNVSPEGWEQVEGSYQSKLIERSCDVLKNFILGPKIF